MRKYKRRRNVNETESGKIPPEPGGRRTELIRQEGKNERIVTIDSVYPVLLSKTKAAVMTADYSSR